MNMVTKPFLEVFSDSSGGNKKTKQSELLNFGDYPVVDQGQSLVAGYTNDKGRLCKAELPVIIFGDHTRALKFVDFPFCMGADGTKVLRPKNEDYPKYLYRVLESIDVPSAGYSRHFKFLKECKIPLPPLSEQKRIAGILDAADGLRAKRRAALAQLDTLLQSTFLDLFGDPGSNPMGWEKVKFGDLIVHGPQNGLYKPSKLYGRGTRILRIDGFYDGRVRPLNKLKRVEISDDERTTYGLKEDDVVVNRVNSREYLGKSAIVPALDEPVVFESNMMRSRLDKLRINPVFTVQYLQSKYVKSQILTASKDAVNQSSINQKDVKGFDFYLPPLDLQRRFATIVESVEQQKARHREHLAQLDTLFASLQQRAFKGEL